MSATAPASTSGMLLCFDDEQAIAQAAASGAGLTLAVIQRQRPFPDGELRLRLPEALPPRVVIWRGLHQPNEKIVELLLVAPTARQLGAQHLTLVAPYLAYMRQDIAFNPGEVVSQRVLGACLATLFDAVVTVDPHLHRVATLAEAVPVKDAVVLSGAPLLADFIASQREDVLLIGPDEESLQWVAQAARQLKAAGAASVDVAVTHALFAAGAEQLIREAGASQIWSTDCIPHASNAVSVVPGVAAALRASSPVSV